MTIKRLKLSNFQAHADLDLEFDPGVTTIVGPSDVGKSAIMRAMRLLACNQPGGSDFIRWGAKKCTVSIETEDAVVTRTRSAAVNKYEVDGREFVAFGKTVPPEVVAALGMEDVNFQGQYDAPFWLGESAGEVSRQLNRVACLEIIDETLAKSAKLVRSTSTQLEVVTDRVKVAKDELAAWDHIGDLETGFDILEVLKTRSDGVAEDVVQLEDVVDAAAESLKSARRAGECADALDRVVQVGFRMADVRGECSDLCALVEDLARYDGILAARIPDIGSLAYVDAKWRVPASEADALGAVLYSMDLANTAYESDRLAYRNADMEFVEAIGDRCPLCDEVIHAK